MSKGFIVVQVYEGDEARPIQSAVVTIFDRKRNKKRKVAVDINGKTKKISVAAPKKEYSLVKNEKELPYDVYDLTISAPGYNTVIVKGVQVFPEVTALQKVEMTIAFKGKSVDKMYTIPEHGLRGKAEGLPTGFEGEGWSPFVLANPVIPEYITVHLGKPTASAKDVTVPFKTYIKNVASSEIYPTWPEVAIRANIYAQISFALNRVFTEWYRNKGYPFQITNSTAFDQYYVDGRNIFDNISEIVDGIFNQYITKSPEKVPLFAQYCNGTSVTCKGLSQWGTVDLANEGKLPYEILQYYYGDLQLVKVSVVEGIPDSYPGVVLKEGSEGDSVSIIQNQLNRIRKNYPAIQAITPVNGIYGKSTKEAVKTFQEIFNLTQTGTVDSATWYKISSIYVGVTKLAELDGSGVGEELPDSSQPDPQPPTGYPGYLLKLGSRGDSVKQLQKYLNQAATSYPTIQKIDEDGIFGPATQKAVIAFQKATGLTQDGIVGPATWGKLVEVTGQRRKDWWKFW